MSKFSSHLHLEGAKKIKEVSSLIAKFYILIYNDIL